jgi:hypothetical protein
VLPWWLYESTSHYAPMGYLAHLWLNLTYAARWLARQETKGDWQFEREVNSPTKGTMMQLLTERPTETLTGPALGLAVFGFATQVGVPTIVAGIFGVVCAFGPLVVSRVVDAVRR